jgi:RimJ/RimL family protein N-acetyltransferase
MDLSRTTIETDRLRLAPISLDYREAIFTEFTREITTFMYPKPPDAISETQAFIVASLHKLAAGTDLVMVILHKDTGEFFGCIGLHELDKPSPEFGIWLKKTAHGHGYGLEAIRGLKAWADAHVPCQSYIYPVDERNVPSRRIPESFGGTVIGRHTHQSASGRELQIVTYEIPKG